MSINPTAAPCLGLNFLRGAVHFIALATFVAPTLPIPTIAAPPLQPADRPISLPIADSHVTAKAKEWFHRLQTGEIDRSQLAAEANSELTTAVVRQESEALAPLGDPTGFAFVRAYPVAEALEYHFLVQFKTAQIVELISFDPSGKIAGLALLSAAPSER